jgi:uncharacterized delta-60 repeat protein
MSPFPATNSPQSSSPPVPAFVLTLALVAAASSSGMQPSLSAPAIASSSGPLFQSENGAVVLGNLIGIERKETAGGRVGAFLLGAYLNPSYNSGGLLLLRRAPSGELDRTFGQEGTVTLSLPPKTNRDFLEVSAILRDSQGRLLVVGWRTIWDLLDRSIEVITVARFTASGALDANYGDHGFVQTRQEHNNVSTANAALLDSEDRLVVAGYGGGIRPDGGIRPIDDWIPRMTVARYTTSGSVDLSFGTKGFTSVPLARVPVPDVPDDRCQQTAATCRMLRQLLLVGRDRERVRGLDNFVGLTLDSQHRLLVAATASDGTVSLLRLQPDGAFERRFSGHGEDPVTLGEGGMLSKLLWDAQGRLIAVGSVKGNIVLMRYTQEGALDPEFGSGGVRLANIGEGFTVSAALFEPKGNLFVAAYTMHRLSLARFALDGTLIPDFGVGGVMSSSYEVIPGVAGIILDADGIPSVLALSRDGVVSVLTRQKEESPPPRLIETDVKPPLTVLNPVA